MSNQMDKVNMSLDDIIKMNRKNKGGQNNNKFGGGRGAAQNKFNGNRRPGQNRRQQNNKQKPKQQQQQQRQQGNFQQQRNKNNFGILNGSKTITKRRKPANQRFNNANNKFVKAAPIAPRQQLTFKTVVLKPETSSKKPLAAKKSLVRRPQGVFNRFSSKAASMLTKQKRTQGTTVPFKTKRFNRLKLNPSQQQQGRPKQKNILQSLKSKLKQQQQQQPMKQRVNGSSGAGILRAKLAMQNAKKNLLKAKKRSNTLQLSKGPIQQIMTQRYANNLLAKQNGQKKQPQQQQGRVNLKLAKNRVNKQAVQNRQRQARRNKQANQRGQLQAGGGKKIFLKRKQQMAGANRTVFL